MTIIKAERTYTVIKFGKKKTERLFGKLKMIFKLFNVSYGFVVLERDNLVQVFLCHDFFGKSQGLFGDL